MGPNGEVSKDFKKQVLGYGPTTAEIVYSPPRSALPASELHFWQDYSRISPREKLPLPSGKSRSMVAVTAHVKLIKPTEPRRGRNVPPLLLKVVVAPIPSDHDDYREKGPDCRDVKSRKVAAPTLCMSYSDKSGALATRGLALLSGLAKAKIALM
jgi:hypothetical protein